jgi:hypothetical protein
MILWCLDIHVLSVNALSSSYCSIGKNKLIVEPTWSQHYHLFWFPKQKAVGKEFGDLESILHDFRLPPRSRSDLCFSG